MAALATLGIPAERNPGLTGVWTRGRKIASLGIHVKQWVTFHGFALNVLNDLRGFGYVVPCGIQDVTMTSVSRELEDPGDPAELWAGTRAAVVAAVAEAFEREPVPTPAGNLVLGAGVSLGSLAEPAARA